MGGRRRGKGDDDDDYPAYTDPPPAQLQRFLSADQSAAAGAAFGGMPAVPMPHYVSQVSRCSVQAKIALQSTACGCDHLIRPDLNPVCHLCCCRAAFDAVHTSIAGLLDELRCCAAQ